MSFKEKYLKYKNKYLLLKNKIKQTGGNHELYVAVSKDDTTKVQEIVKGMLIDNDPNPIDYNYVQPDGALGKYKKMVNIAIDNNNYKILEILLNSRALDNSRAIDINNKDENGNTYFMNAILKGNLFIINLIFKFNPDLKLTNNDGNTALQLAIISGNVNLIKFLQSYQESLMEEEEYLHPDEPDTPMINYVLPGEIVALIDSFTTTTRLVIAPGIYRYITAAEGGVLKNCVRKDFVDYNDTIPYPLDKIIRDLQPPIDNKPVLIIDGENALGEFRSNPTYGNFFTQGRYQYFIRNGVVYEINILLLFIRYCKINNYGKLIIVCKNNRYFESLVTEYNTGTIQIRRWNASNKTEILPPLSISSAIFKATIGLDFTIDIIHVTANCSYTKKYPKDLRSYDDCLILGLVLKYMNKGIEVFYYTKDSQILYDFFNEKEKLLPFVVKINQQKSFLFQPHLEPWFFGDLHIDLATFNNVLGRNTDNDSDTILNTYLNTILGI